MFTGAVLLHLSGMPWMSVFANSATPIVTVHVSALVASALRMLVAGYETQLPQKSSLSLRHNLEYTFVILTNQVVLSRSVKLLLAIISCHHMQDRAKAVRDTWLTDIPVGLDYKFFLGRVAKREPVEDEIFLDVNDTYTGLPAKTRAICEYAVANGYDWLHKIDDDVYCRAERLLHAVPQHGQYVGRRRSPSGGFPSWYCSGFSYWLDAAACRIVANAPLSSDECEDRWVGNALMPHGIDSVLDNRYIVFREQPFPAPGNNIISVCEFKEKDMYKAHQYWQNGGIVPQQHVVNHPCRVAIQLRKGQQ